MPRGFAADLIGERFGKLIVMEKGERMADGRVTWVCLCECGGEHISTTYCLKSGETKSCGCLKHRKTASGNIVQSRARSYPHSLIRLQVKKPRNADVDPYLNLANAIVAVAVDDYRYSLQKNNIRLRKFLITFFKSKWFSLLTTLDGMELLLELEEEFKRGDYDVQVDYDKWRY